MSGSLRETARVVSDSCPCSGRALPVGYPNTLERAAIAGIKRAVSGGIADPEHLFPAQLLGATPPLPTGLFDVGGHRA